MVFSAINTYEDEVKERTKRHTLEMQFEQAMNVYKSALIAQKTNKFEEARNLYIKLFSFDVLSPPPQSSKPNQNLLKSDSATESKPTNKSRQLGPAIRLRAMALKNCAELLLSESPPPNSSINEALGFLQEALDLVGTDDREKLVLPSLVQVSWAIGNLRNARLGLEILVENTDGSAINPLEIWRSNKESARYLLNPRTIEMLESLDFLYKYIDGDLTLPVPRFLRKFEHVGTPASDESNTESTIESTELTVSLGAKNWTSLIKSLENSLTSIAKRSKKRTFGDLYSWSTKEYYIVKFTGFLFNNSFNGDSIEHVEHVEQTAQVEQVEGKDREQAEGHDKPEPVTDVEKPSTNTTDTDTPDTTTEKDTSNLAHTSIDNYINLKRRRIERSKRSSLALPADFGVADEYFISQINAYIALCDQISTTSLESPAILFQNQEEYRFMYGASDLKEILNTWDTRESQLFLTETSVRPQKEGIMSILRKGQNNSNSTPMPSTDDDFQTEGNSNEVMKEVDQFVDKFNGFHVQIVRLNLTLTLLNKLIAGGKSVGFGQMTLKCVDQIESILYERQNLISDEQVVAIFGLYADSWISKRQDTMKLKTKRWQMVSARVQSGKMGCLQGLEHLWISAFVDQEHANATPEQSISRFEALQTRNEFLPDDSNKFSHLIEIPKPTKHNNLMQISKFKAAASFEKLLSPQKGQEQTEKVLVLESILMPESHSKPSSITQMEFDAIQEFLGYVHPQFKLGLWYILLENYQETGSLENSLKGLMHIFLQSMDAYDQGQSLLSTLNIAHDVGKRLIPMLILEKSPNLFNQYLDDETAVKVCLRVIQLLQTLQLFVVYDDAVYSNLLQKPGVASWLKVFEKFRELIVYWWCIFYHFWLRLSRNTSKETINDLLSIIHERLGKLGYCCIADSCLLNLHIQTITRLDWDGSSLDFSQCLNCMYGYNLSLFGDLSNHHTLAKPITDVESVKITPYFMKTLTSYRSFGQAVVRNDIRQIIEELAKARQTLNLDEQIEFINAYLLQDFTPELLGRCWHGQDDNKLLKLEQSCAKFHDEGLNLVQALVLLNQYKMRRRQTYNAASLRIETLESAIEFFKKDLAGYPKRVESWGGLSQAFSILCEDSLTFGKELGAEYEASEYCRFTLISVSRAVALLVQRNQRDHHGIGGNGNNNDAHFQNEVWDNFCKPIWFILGKYLLMAVAKPFMSQPLEAKFRVFRPFLIKDSTSEFSRVALKPPGVLKGHFALQIAVLCLGKKNTTDQTQRFISLAYRSQAAIYLYETDETAIQPYELIDILLDARNAAPKDNVPEIDCKLVNTIWSLSKSHKVTEKYAKSVLEFINTATTATTSSSTGDTGTSTTGVTGFSTGTSTTSSTGVTGVTGDTTTTDGTGGLLNIITTTLHKLIEKNKWLHEARYTLSRIKELEYKDYEGAIDNMLNLFTLKSPTKPLVLWKHDTDLPGSVSVMMNKYIRYLADLFYNSNKINGLLLLVKRFRKAGYEIFMYTACFEKIFGQCCLAYRRMSGLQTSLNAKQSEAAMSYFISMGPAAFDQLIKRLCDNDKLLNENSTWIQSLYFTTELRKLHIGPKTNAQADELVILTLFGIVQHVKSQPDFKEETENVSGDTNNSKPSKKNKLLRKDVLNAAQMILRQHLPKLNKTENLNIIPCLGEIVSQASDPKENKAKELRGDLNESASSMQTELAVSSSLH